MVSIIVNNKQPRKKATLDKRWLNIGPTSEMLAKHGTHNAPMFDRFKTLIFICFLQLLAMPVFSTNNRSNVSY